MKMLLWLLAIGLVLLLMFAIANWSLLAAPASLNFLLFSVDGPLGIVLLGATLVLIALCAAYVLWLRTATLVELRQQRKELETQRTLADNAEASRFTELRAHVDAEAERQRVLTEEARAAALARTDALESTLLGALRETSNSLAAYVGEVDEKLNRLSSTAPGSSIGARKREI